MTFSSGFPLAYLFFISGSAFGMLPTTGLRAVSPHPVLHLQNVSDSTLSYHSVNPDSILNAFIY